MDHRDAYVAFQEGTRLLANDNAHAAVIALERVRDLEPGKGSVREALARAYYRIGRFDAAEEEFLAALDLEPVNDYAHFGIGLCRLRAGDRTGARGHLRQAAVMRPENADYRAALDRAEPDRA
jgi:Flp pilus assembly protein TadD